VAFAKVGKTTFGQQLAAHVAMGRPFLERATQRTRVLALPAEDPPEYTAWLARHLSVDCGWLTFRCAPMVLDADALTRICGTVKEGHYGLVLISSWQAVARGLIRDENDNAGSVQLVEAVKAAARASGVPWLIDAHSGKGEDQADAADPSKAMRGASAAAGAADFTLSLRYGNGTFGPQRRLSGKGRFVSFGPLVLDFDSATGAYAVVGESQAVHRETTWQEICLMGALSTEPRSVTEIAKRLGLEKVSGAARRRILSALQDRPTVGRVEMMRRGQKTVLYRLLETP
jgi:hypothetical protein